MCPKIAELNIMPEHESLHPKDLEKGEVAVYSACGLTLRSEIELRGFYLRDQIDEVEVTVERGLTPAQLDVEYRREHYDAGPGIALVHAPRLGRILVEGGNRVIVDAPMSVSDSEIAAFLSGTVMSALLHQRGFLPLHAGCVEVDGGAFAFVGSSGAGKSTLIAALAKRRYPVMADDVAAISLTEEKLPRVTSGVRSLKLNPDSTDALGLDIEGSVVIENTGKRQWAVHRADPCRVIPLRRIYQLTIGGQPAYSRPSLISGLEKLEILKKQTHRWGLGACMGCGLGNMDIQLAIASSVPMYRLQRPDQFDRLDSWVDWVEEQLEAEDVHPELIC
ncbi:MAG: hypothetical protein AAF514_12305 [Verrucomicrobiota bacterium]